MIVPDIIHTRYNFEVVGHRWELTELELKNRSLSYIQIINGAGYSDEELIE
jgi:hypothetical protein